MKNKILFIGSMLFTALSSNATVHTVSNSPYSPGQYTSIQEAHDAASSGDTLYIHGSPTSYGSANITKKLIIIGAGALPNKKYEYRTDISSINLEFNTLGTSSASGSKLSGINISAIYLKRNTAGLSVTNIIIERNEISSISFTSGVTSGDYTGVIIKNNIISSLTSTSGQFTKAQIRNNIIRSVITHMNESTISNNIFLGAYISGCINSSIFNNIFYLSPPTNFTSNTYCSISNNCFINSSQTFSSSNLIYGTNTGGQNLYNVDPQFINDGAGSTAIQSYSYTSPATGPYINYNLNSTSPCLTSGVGGTDMGIYGGTTPFFEGSPADSRFRYYPMPYIPTMLDMNILNPNVLPNGTLDVEFKAAKQN